MKRAFFVLFFSIIFVIGASAAFALELSADLYTETQGHSVKSKVYMKGDRFRIEPQGQPGYTLIRQDLGVVWIVMPEEQAYMEMPYDASNQPQTDTEVKGEISRKLLGEELIDNHKTKKYEVTHKDSSGREEVIYQWIAEDLDFPVKMMSQDGKFSVIYRNIDMSTQKDELFTMPDDYDKIQMPMMGTGMGQGMPPGGRGGMYR